MYSLALKPVNIPPPLFVVPVIVFVFTKLLFKTKRRNYEYNAISGALCGMAGMMQASAMEKSLTYQLSGGMGFTAVITTWLGQLNPIIITVVSFLFSMLIQGGGGLQASLGIQPTMAQVIQGIIIFFVLGSEFFLKYKFVWTSNKTVEDK